MIVTFCGHSTIYHQEEVSKRLDRIIESLIEEGATQFLLGGYGQFDMLAARSVAKSKLYRPDLESILVIPYQ